MKDEILKYLYDIQEAANAILSFVARKGFEEYATNDLLQSGVERKFEIIGEALNRIQKNEPEILDRIRDCREIISFRNILAHGYDSIDERVVWGVIKEDLVPLLKDVEALLGTE